MSDQYEMSEEAKKQLRKRIEIKLENLRTLSPKELISLDKYEELYKKVEILLIYLDDFIKEWRTNPSAFCSEGE